MASITEQNVLNEIHKPDGSIVRQYPITKAENIIGFDKLTTQQTKALKLLAVNSYIVDDVTGKTYKISMVDGKPYFAESDVSVLDLLDTIVEATTPTE